MFTSQYRRLYTQWSSLSWTSNWGSSSLHLIYWARMYDSLLNKPLQKVLDSPTIVRSDYKIDYFCQICTGAAESSLYSLEIVQKHLLSLLNEELFQSYSRFPADEMSHACNILSLFTWEIFSHNALLISTSSDHYMLRTPGRVHFIPFLFHL